MEFIKVITTDQLKKLSELASIVWHEYFPRILTNEQIDYMIDKFQSYDALGKQLDSGYTYYLLKKDKYLGYFGFKEDRGLFLSKLYLMDYARGLGYTTEIFAFLENYANLHRLSRIWLTVNKYNTHTIEVYQHFGYKIIKATVTDIGNGYVMDDYIMEKLVGENNDNCNYSR